MSRSKLALGCAAFAVAASTWIGAPRSALAAEPGPEAVPMNVVTIEGNDAEDQAEALTKALRNAVRASRGWSLAPGDFSLEVIVLSLKCSDPPDPQCQARIADEIKSDRYVWGYLKKKGSNVAGEVALWVRGKGTTRIPIEYSANLTEANEEALKKVATDAMTTLAGVGPKGGVHVSAGGIVGQLFIDGEPMGALVGGEITLQIQSGQHVVVVKAPGYANAEAGVTIKPNATADVSLKLVKEAPKSGINGRAVAGWSLLGGGVALAGAGALMGGLQIGNKSGLTGTSPEAMQFNDSRTGTVLVDGTKVGGQNGCDQAATEKNGVTSTAAPGRLQHTQASAKKIDDICSKDKLFTILQFVFYPTAVVAGGAGIYFLVTSSPKSAPPAQGWNVQPTFGPTGGKLDLTVRF